MTLSEKIQNEARKGQTAIELARLAEEIECWVEKRKKKDVNQYHQTQLEAIRKFLARSIDFLQASLNQINVNQPRAEIYEACQLFDLRVLWLWKVWRYFKDKFDQRDDESLGPLLRAADEVVWSCYRQIFSRAEAFGLGIHQGVAPLPFVESEYSPESFPSECTHREHG
jgi:hypothetical protein